MRKFTKGKLETVVEDKDRRIPEYLANGWKEVTITPKTPTEAEALLEKSKKDANTTEPKKGGKKQKAGATDQKVNDTIKANANAADEGEEIDDGLVKKEG